MLCHCYTTFCRADFVTKNPLPDISKCEKIATIFQRTCEILIYSRESVLLPFNPREDAGV